MIPHTNLIFVVADKMCPCFSNKVSIVPTKVDYGATNETSYCEKLKYNILRRKPTHCVNYHAEVIFIEQTSGRVTNLEKIPARIRKECIG
jgi:hypothetical protein